MELVIAVYTLSENFPNDERFGITSQIRRSVVSIPSNIAEGKMRGGDIEFRRFLLIAFASGAELETQIDISKRLILAKDADYSVVDSLLSDTMRMLNGLITKLEASS